MKALWTALFVLASFTQHAVAQPTGDGGAKGAGAMRTVRVIAMVEAVDQENRIVTLKDREGDIVAVRVGDDVRNLDRLEAGDVVEIDYQEAIALDIKPTDAAPTASETTSIERSKPGAKPGGVAKRKVHLVTEVMGVNPESQSLLIRGPLGHRVRVKVNDPARLAEFKTGGQIDVTYIESLAIAVRKKEPK